MFNRVSEVLPRGGCDVQSLAACLPKQSHRRGLRSVTLSCRRFESVEIRIQGRSTSTLPHDCAIAKGLIRMKMEHDFEMYSQVPTTTASCNRPPRWW